MTNSSLSYCQKYFSDFYRYHKIGFLKLLSFVIGQCQVRSNYQAAIWKKALCQMPDIPSPADHGWEIDGENISIKWLSTKPAPEEIIELISCECKKICIVEKCCCIQASLNCIDLCKIKCDNVVKEDQTTDYGDDGESDLDDDIELFTQIYI